ncbi:MAG: hypothetical protein FWF81_11515 [Defluviitaleaceae bacterium]|nr:hypothetical protein [Defluviitaleaceae bacterium]
MFQFNENVGYNKFDAIVLSLQKYEQDQPHPIEEDGGYCFRTLGDFDYFSITPTLIDEKISDSAGFMRKFNKVLDGLKRELNKKPGSFHHVFCIASDEGAGDFWGKQYNYTLMSLVQLGSCGKGFYDAKDAIKDFLDDEKQKHCDFDYFIYSSFDVSDLVIFVKSNIARHGKRVFLSMTKSLDLDYHGYTRAGFLPDEILKDNDARSEEIDRFMIFSTIRDPQIFKKWMSSWKKKYPEKIETYSRMGNEEFSITLKGLTRLELINELNNGLLKCVEFKKQKRSSKIIIVRKSGVLKEIAKSKQGREVGYLGAILRPRNTVDIAEGFDITANGMNNEEKITILDKYKRYTIVENESFEKHMESILKDSIQEIFRIISMFEKNYFARDVVACVKSTYPGFIEGVRRKNDSIDNAEGLDYSNRKIELYDDIIYYINAVTSLIRGTLSADRMFFQVPGFRLSLCDIQSKLVVFYMAFTQKLVKFLNGDMGGDIVYGVVPNIGLHHQISLKELFADKTSKEANILSTIQLPVITQFSQINMLPRLIHEVSHLRSNKFRNRKLRDKSIIKSVSEIHADLILNIAPSIVDSDKYEMFMDSSNFLLPDGDMVRHIAKEISVTIYDLIRKRYDEESKEVALITRQVEDCINKEMYNFYSHRNMEKVMKSLFYEILKFQNQSKMERSQYLQHLDNFATSIHEWQDIMLNTEGDDILGVRHICTLFNESFSDVVMLKISGICVVQYIYLFASTAKNHHKNDTYYEELLLFDHTYVRLVSVIKAIYGIDCMCDDEIDDILKNDKDYDFFAKGEHKDYFNAFKKLISSKKNDKHAEILIGYTGEYLKKCACDFDENANAEECAEIKEIFKKAARSKNLCEFMKNLHDQCQYFYDYDHYK